MFWKMRKNGQFSMTLFILQNSTSARKQIVSNNLNQSYNLTEKKVYIHVYLYVIVESYFIILYCSIKSFKGLHMRNFQKSNIETCNKI